MNIKCFTNDVIRIVGLDGVSISFYDDKDNLIDKALLSEQEN